LATIVWRARRQSAPYEALEELSSLTFGGRNSCARQCNAVDPTRFQGYIGAFDFRSGTGQDREKYCDSAARAQREESDRGQLEELE
jgi:hypothetical protein